MCKYAMDLHVPVLFYRIILRLLYCNMLVGSIVNKGQEHLVAWPYVLSFSGFRHINGEPTDALYQVLGT